MTKQVNSIGSPRRTGLSGVVYLIIIVGITIGVTFTVVGDITDSFDTMTSSNRLAIETVNAYTDGDRMVITGNIKNLGSQPISSVLIDEISVGRMTITQDAHTDDGQIEGPHGSMTFSGIAGDGTTTVPTGAAATVDVDADVTGAGGSVTQVNHGAAFTTDDGNKFVFGGTATGAIVVVDVTGLTTDEGNQAAIGAGQSKSFRIVITGVSAGNSGAATLDILETVPASAELFITVTGTDGSTTTISEPRTTRVTQR